MQRTWGTSELRLNLLIAKIREFWRELARPVTFFDLCSPGDFLDREIREFFRKWCARRDSNAGPRLRRAVA
jgi:hypothetical protein